MKGSRRRRLAGPHGRCEGPTGGPRPLKIGGDGRDRLGDVTRRLSRSLLGSRWKSGVFNLVNNESSVVGPATLRLCRVSMVYLLFWNGQDCMFLLRSILTEVDFVSAKEYLRLQAKVVEGLRYRRHVTEESRFD